MKCPRRENLSPRPTKAENLEVKAAPTHCQDPAWAAFRELAR
jgi:hypothetical protein